MSAQGQVRALATTGKTRSSVLPDVPTADEAGVPGYEATIWLGLMAPAGTPKPIIDKLNAAVNDAVKRPEIVKLWAEQGAVPMSMTPEEFDKYLRGDIVKWADVVKQFPDKPQIRFSRPRCRTFVFASMASRPRSTPIPIHRCSAILRGPLGLTGPHFGCGAGECGACNVIVGDHAVTSCDTPLWSVADKDVTTIEGLGSARKSASAAARLHRRTGAAMRLLRLRHPDERRRAVDAKSQSYQRGREGRARPQPVPLRFA